MLKLLCINFYAFKDCKPDMELSFSTASVPFLIPVLLSLSFLSQEIGLCFDISNNGWHIFPRAMGLSVSIKKCNVQAVCAKPSSKVTPCTGKG